VRTAARRDSAEAAIVEALERCGALVMRCSQPCDLLVQFRHRLFLLEVKTPKRSADKRQQAQRDFLREWGVPVVRTAEDALVAIGATKPKCST
jgi:hypothetical protein